MRNAARASFEFRTHGGARSGAGRKPAHGRAGVSHAVRELVTPRTPVHVTLRVRDHVWNLRSRRCSTIIRTAVDGVRGRAESFRIVHCTIQGNHVHLVAEASDGTALSRGMNALCARIAKGLNRLMQRGGAVFADRFHLHVLRSLREARNAVRYALGNFARHAARRGEPVGPAVVDRYAWELLAAPRSWLLQAAGWCGDLPAARGKAAGGG